MTSPGLFPLLLLVIAAFLAGAALAWWAASRSRALLERSIQQTEALARGFETRWKEAIDESEPVRRQLAVAREEIARLEERNAADRRALDLLREQMHGSLPGLFKSLAGEVLGESSRQAAEAQQNSLDQMLLPLRNRIEDFQQRIEAVHLEQVRGAATLREQVSRLVESTSRVSDEANSLANALKGSNKLQGNWGELVLEKILESAGLRAGQEYVIQQSYAAEDGRRSQPDVVIHLPGGRHLVIDSKVSLSAYEAHANAESDGARSQALTEHLKSVRAHIKGLAEKNYQSLYGLNSLDFVIMFVPIEPAFMLALAADEKLWQQAWQKNLLLVSPSTLLFVLRTVSYLWRQEQQERNVEEIARRGAELYNKLAGFVESFVDVGDRLTQAHKSYEDAMTRLSTGRGNVIRQAEMLKVLGIKPSKHLPQGLVERAGQEILELGGLPELDR